MTGQTLDLFEVAELQARAPAAVHLPPPKITVRRQPRAATEGRRLAEEGAQLAIDKADKDTGDEFSRAAVPFFIAYARKAYPTPVGVAEARLASVGVVPAVANARAWGQVPKAAEKQGAVRFAGHGPSSDPKSHSTPRGLWLYQGER